MPCEWYKSADGVVIHVNTTRGRKQLCKFCGQKSNDMKLCDFPVGNGKTCDAQMCSECARTLGGQTTDTGHGLKRLNDTIDVCPIHRDRAVTVKGKIAVKGEEEAADADVEL